MDKARKWTDKQLEKMESEIVKIYKKTNKDITEKWNSYMKSEQKRLDALKAEAERTGDMYEYQRVLRNFTLQNQKYQSMVNQTTEKIANANKIAVDYLNEKTPSIYSTNYNQVIGEVNGMKANINFDMVDESTVKKLIKNGSIDLLPKKVDISKDMKWNTKKINSQVMQGILQGESIGDISKRLQNVTDMNEKSAIRNARTMTTNAECMGRMDSYHELQDAGVVLKKVWIATADERTRAWHTDLDGVEMDIDEPFVAILADGTEDDIMYPGDPDADPANVYNCRCSLETRIISIDDVDIDEENEDVDIPVVEKEDNKNFIETEFIPATTIEEAEAYAKERFITGGMNLTGKSISYKGIDVDVANTINKRLDEIYANFKIDKLSSLEAYSKTNRRIYQQHQDAPLFATNFGNIGMNTTFLKNQKQIEKYIKDGKESFDFVIKNMDALSGESLKLAQAYKIAGKSLVGESLEDMITHEIGHHISYMPNVNKMLADVQKNDDWKEYAKHLSGYANHSFGEYVAESFDAYYRKEFKSLQPEMKKIFDELRK